MMMMAEEEEGSSSLSEYEQGRLQNMHRNNEVLKGLGLLKQEQQQEQPVPSSRKRKRKTRSGICHNSPRQGKRQSRRIKGEDTSGKKLPKKPVRAAVIHVDSDDEGYDLALWTARLFKEHTEKCTGARGKCTASATTWGQHHQHLTLNADRTIVANTGCAGYGGVIMDMKPAIKQLHNRSGGHATEFAWQVGVLRMGVGGFAVGVGISTGLKRPFKSFGNHPHAWVFHSQGYTSHNRIRKNYTAGSRNQHGYEHGDVVSVILRPHASAAKAGSNTTKGSAQQKPGKKAKVFWDLFFEVKSKGGKVQKARVPAYSKLSFLTGLPILICQPYMQGAAKIIGK
jgi:hypothetical protein